MAEYERGKMDITDHERTFAGFIQFWVYIAAFTVGTLITLALLTF